MENKRDLGLDTVRVEKQKLIETLKANKETHITEFDESVKSYHTELLTMFDKKRREIKKADTSDILDINVLITIPKPTSYEDDYTTTLEMLDWSIDEHIDLTQREFKRYILDEWDWSDGFKAVTSNYLGGR